MNGTQLRFIILAVLSVAGFIVPIPEDMRAQIAEHATNLISAVLALWAIFAGLRMRKQQAGEES